MITPKEIDALVGAGATAEMLAAVFKVAAQEEEAKLACRRAKDAERQRRYRLSRGVTVTNGDTQNGQREKEKERTKEREREKVIYIPIPEGIGESEGKGKPKPKSSLAEKSFLAEFDRFWRVFPRRQGKGGALRGFRAALKRGASADEIVAGAERYAALRKGQDRQFTAMPTTWLNQDRWLDEEEIAKPGFTLRNLGPQRTWAEIKAERGLARLKVENVVEFPGVRPVAAPVEGEGLDALVCGDDQGQEGRTGQDEPRGAGLLDILPALQALDHSQEN